MNIFYNESKSKDNFFFTGGGGGTRASDFF